MNVKRKTQALIQTSLYQALETCWEPSCYVTEQTRLSSCDCWWIPGELFKRVFFLTVAIADKDAIVISGYTHGDEYPVYSDGARYCSC